MEKRSCSNAQYPVFSEPILPVSQLCFTQRSIGVQFSGAHNQSRIDDAVRDILANKLNPQDFPILEVFYYDGCIWSFNNRRLWVLKKACVSVVTVRILPQDLHKESFRLFLEDVASRPERLSRMAKSDYFPRVQGKCKTNFGFRLRVDQTALVAQYPVDSEHILPVSRLCFTQTSIGVCFSGAHKHVRIDDAVREILANELKPEDFPVLEVVPYEGFIWSLNNRRLWVFRKAGIGDVKVQIVPHDLHRKRFGSFLQELESQPELLRRLTRKDFYPQVRGKCKTSFRARVSKSTPGSVVNETMRKPSKGKEASSLPDNSKFRKFQTTTHVSSLPDPYPCIVSSTASEVPDASRDVATMLALLKVELEASRSPDSSKFLSSVVNATTLKPASKVDNSEFPTPGRPVSSLAIPTSSANIIPPSEVLQDERLLPDNCNFQTAPPLRVSSLPDPTPVTDVCRSILPNNTSFQTSPLPLVSSLPDPNPVKNRWGESPLSIRIISPSKVENGIRLPVDNSKFQTFPASSRPDPKPVTNILDGSPPPDDTAPTKPLLWKGFWAQFTDIIRSLFSSRQDAP